MIKAENILKVLKEFRPEVNLLSGFDRHILSLNINENDSIELYYSLWGVISQIIIDMNLSYVDAMEYLIKKVSIEKANQSDVTYFFYDDLPNPQLN